MLRRLFFVALALLGLYIWLKRRFGAAGAATRAARTTPAGADRMVRDRICNTFLPRSAALVLTDGGQEHHFCSENCRDAYLAGRRKPEAAAVD